MLGRDQCPWAKVNAYSDDLKSLVKSDSELWQVLHHALCFHYNTCYLVIGDGRFPIVAVCIQFPVDLLKAYANVICHVTNKTPALNFVQGNGTRISHLIVWILET